MHPKRFQLIALQLLGGPLVLGSYAWGFLANSAAMGALWGGVPEAARPLYTVNMFLAAAGYLLFAHTITFRLDLKTSRIAGRDGFRWFATCLALVLFPSAAWLPLTAVMLENPSTGLWWLIRIDLALVALGSLGIAVGLALPRPAPRGRALALVGALPFCFQTAILDALVWPAYFTVAGP